MKDTKPTWEEEFLKEFVPNAQEFDEYGNKVLFHASAASVLNFIRANFLSRSQVAEVIESKMRDEKYGMDVIAFKGTVAARSFNKAYNKALQDIKSTLLDSEKKG